MTYNNPDLIIETNQTIAGKITWRSPSNLAIVKYWGKYGQQLPRNPSISFTLDAAYTETILEYAPKEGVDEGIDLTFFFEGKENEPFRQKLIKFLSSITTVFPFLKQLKLTINSHNSFPHSAGIASSASSMSAVALCLCTLEDRLFGTLKDNDAFHKKASFVSRLGSGSACRSIYSKAALWGETGELEGSSNLWAVGYEDKMHEVFHTFHDDILIVSKGEKSVSSSAGHGLMENNAYAEPRYNQAKQRLHHLLHAMEIGDIERFGTIAENEALTLHALMMTSNPSYILMKPNSLLLIDKVRQFRKDTSEPLYFSLDAGPNLHLLYPDANKEKIQAFIKEELKPYCDMGKIIMDTVGRGPLEL